MTESITIKRLTIGTIIKLTIIGYGLPILLFVIACSVAATLGADTVKLNNEYVTGASALLSIPVFCAVWIVFGALCGCLAFVGLWLYSLIRPLRIDVVK